MGTADNNSSFQFAFRELIVALAPSGFYIPEWSLTKSPLAVLLPLKTTSSCISSGLFEIPSLLFYLQLDRRFVRNLIVLLNIVFGIGENYRASRQRPDDKRLLANVGCELVQGIEDLEFAQKRIKEIYNIKRYSDECAYKEGPRNCSMLLELTDECDH